MKQTKNILIIGLGAIGSIYAAKFHKKDPESLRILINQDRLFKYKNNPLVFNAEKYDFNYVLETDNEKKADIILIATKNNTFSDAVKMIRPFVKEDTVILSLLNGISSERVLIDEFGTDKVLYSYFIGHASVKDGRKVSHDGIGKIVFGEKNNKELSDKVSKVKEVFDSAGIDYLIPEDMLSSMWQKFVINVGINQASAVFYADYKKMQESKEARDLTLNLMSEAVEIAKAIGIKGYESFIEQTFKVIDKMPPGLKSSMFQDIENKRQTEVDIFSGEIIKLGRKLGIKTPFNEFAFNKIKEIETDFIKTKDCLCTR